MLTNCPNCGAGINPGYDRCIKCGTVFPPQQTMQQPQQQPQQQQPYQPANQPYQPPQPGRQYGVQSAPKSKSLAIILALFFGWLGVHNFYLGYTTKAWWQLLLSVLSAGFLMPFIMLWGWVEMLMLLIGAITTDAQNVPLN